MTRDQLSFNMKIVRSGKYMCCFCNRENPIVMQRISKYVKLCTDHIEMLKREVVRVDESMELWERDYADQR